MCGNDGFFHGKITSPYFGKRRRNKPAEEAVDPAQAERLRIEQEAATAANTQLAATRRRRRQGSLLGAGRSVLGAPAGAGAASGGGSVLSGGSETYGAGSGFDRFDLGF
jgi:hypothetical protein